MGTLSIIDFAMGISYADVIYDIANETVTNKAHMMHNVTARVIVVGVPK